MTRARARSRKRLPYWVGPLVVILIAFAALAVVLLASRANDADIAAARGVEDGRPCTKLEDAVGKDRLRAPPCTIVEITHVYLATVKTSVGTIHIAMQPRLAPKSVNNFIFLAKAGLYDGTTFHRIENTQSHAIVQGGDPTGTGRGDFGYTFKEEATPQTRYVRGVVAMASGRGAGINGSQFFIVVRDWPDLVGASGLPTETFFGVVEPGDEKSFQTLDKMVNVPVSGTKPVTAITITSVTVEDTSARPSETPTPSPSVTVSS